MKINLRLMSITLFVWFMWLPVYYAYELIIFYDKMLLELRRLAKNGQV